jgi:hypothetical protein
MGDTVKINVEQVILLALATLHKVASGFAIIASRR